MGCIVEDLNFKLSRDEMSYGTVHCYFRIIRIFAVVQPCFTCTSCLTHADNIAVSTTGYLSFSYILYCTHDEYMR